ncbi:MFS transporter [Candidatus Bipolaricaulota bacterium]|nr:MFS transporter [Candidatus Bipolaricaulota bacterium]
MKEPEASKSLRFTLLSLSFFGVSLTFTIFPLLILPIEESLNISHSLAGLIYTIMFIASAVGRFTESFGADQIGRDVFIYYPGYLIVAGATIFALSPTYWLLVLGALLMGLGNGLFIPAGFAAVSELFPNERGKFIGLYDSIFPLSALGAYAVTSIGTLLGSWRFAVGLLGIYLFFITMGLYLIQGPPARNDEGSSVESFSLTDQVKEAIKKAKNSPVFLKMVTLIIPVSIFAKGVVNFIPAYLIQARGLSQGLANLLYIVFMGLIIPGKMISGRALDRKGARWTFLFVIGFILAGFTLFSQIPGLWAIGVGIFLVAPGRGGIYTTMHSHLLDKLPKTSVNLLYGLFMVSLSVFGSIGPGLVGILIDNIGFRLSFAVLLFVVLFTLPLVLSIDKKEESPT